MKNSNKKTRTTDRIQSRTVANAYSERVSDLYDMVRTVLHGDWGVDYLKANWGDVADVECARVLMVEALVKLGAMTAEDAKKNYGITL